MNLPFNFEGCSDLVNLNWRFLIYLNNLNILYFL